MIAGRKGKIEFGTAGTIDYTGKPVMTPPTTVNQTKNMSSWKVDFDLSTLSADVFLMGGYKTSSSGIISWTGSMDAVFDPSDTTGQVALRTAAKNGEEIYFAFYVDDKHKVEGNAFITKFSIDANAGDYVKCSLDITGNGALCGDI